ncbi:hypothetical protein MWN41_08540 [Ornithobacterium rhinotracheale]|uniref:hypothetical protein n=1 Tax=Ornithobacterium rhinotracheale TaxID=28251 RepID=UPI001FF5B699|nr:hypothetical protein [Ornithobacterium rhinotracheale]MCK0203059.1 hypothetical protein [Ornithobacterium rhinotracheale]
MGLENLTDEQLAAELKRRKRQQEEDRKAYKALVNDNVPRIAETLKTLSQNISQVKLFAFENLKTLLDLKSKAYGVDWIYRHFFRGRWLYTRGSFLRF